MATEKRERQRAAREERLARESKQAKRRKSVRQGIIIAVVAAVVVGTIYLFTHKSSSPSANTTTTSAAMTPTTAHGPATADALAQAKANKIAVAAGCPSSPTARVNTMSWSSAPAMTIDTAKVYTALINTDLGPFTITLDAKSAPVTTNNFVFLAQHGYYNCIIFHRVIPNFMNQTGDPTGTGMGGPGYTIADENPPKATPQYAIGAVAMANTGAPHSGGSQFFVVTGSEGQNLPNTYATFGQVTAGMDVMHRIEAQGGTAANNGSPPAVYHRILTVTISSH
jgi:cyclophilin family peptidyl-prolyl cis-trans isomerase